VRKKRHPCRKSWSQCTICDNVLVAGRMIGRLGFGASNRWRRGSMRWAILFLL
jgi:hypothetical protein